MDPKQRVSKRAVACETVKERRRERVSSSSSDVGDGREPGEPKSDDSRDVLRGESEVGAGDDT